MCPRLPRTADGTLCRHPCTPQTCPPQRSRSGLQTPRSNNNLLAHYHHLLSSNNRGPSGGGIIVVLHHHTCSSFNSIPRHSINMLIHRRRHPHCRQKTSCQGWWRRMPIAWSCSSSYVSCCTGTEPLSGSPTSVTPPAHI